MYGTRHPATGHRAQAAALDTLSQRRPVQHAQGHDAGGPMLKVLADLSVTSTLAHVWRFDLIGTTGQNGSLWASTKFQNV